MFTGLKSHPVSYPQKQTNEISAFSQAAQHKDGSSVINRSEHLEMMAERQTRY